MNDRLIIDVHRRTKPGTRGLLTAMLILGILMLLAGIFLSRGFMMPCFLMFGLYFIFEFASKKDYEYIFEGGKLEIDVVRGAVSKKPVHLLDLDRLVVVAPHDHETVDPYRKGGEQGNLPKFDYTSYDDQIPYYTMITYEDGREIKLLLDLTDQALVYLSGRYPQKVIE